MTGRLVAGSLLILMGVGLLANQAYADSWRWILGAAIGLPFAVPGLAVLVGRVVRRAAGRLLTEAR
jgi:hypothetical protein